MSHRAYILILLILILMTISLKFLFYKNAIGCNDFGSDGTFMAYCGVRTHGHYDHAAYLFDLEEGIYDRVRQANLLFLGDSHLQVGFSTQAFIDLKLHHPTVRPYLLGFGHGEKHRFALEVMKRIKPKPTLIVIDADSFSQGN